MKRWPFVPNVERSQEVFAELARRWRDRSFAFHHLEPPERKYKPESIQDGSIEHAWYLFFAAWLNRQGKSAEQLFRGAEYLIGEYGTALIDPEQVGNLFIDYDEIKDVVPYGRQNPERVDEWWRECLMILRDDYHSDPREILLSLDLDLPPTELRKQAVRRLEKFPGIGHKIAQLLVIWLQEASWKNRLEDWEKVRRIPVLAVDVWWMRQVYQLGLINEYSSDITTKISSPLADFICEVCAEKAIPHNDLAQAVWNLSQDYCARARVQVNAGHNYRNICCGCPASDFCLGIVPANSHKEGRNKRVVHASIDWGKFQPHPKNIMVSQMLPF